MTFPNKGSSRIISHMDFISQNVGWVVGWYGYAARTSNGGVAWTQQNISTPEEILLGLSVFSETEAYAVGIPRPRRARRPACIIRWTPAPGPAASCRLTF